MFIKMSSPKLVKHFIPSFHYAQLRTTSYPPHNFGLAVGKKGSFLRAFYSLGQPGIFLYFNHMN